MEKSENDTTRRRRKCRAYNEYRTSQVHAYLRSSEDVVSQVGRIENGLHPIQVVLAELGHASDGEGGQHGRRYIRGRLPALETSVGEGKHPLVFSAPQIEKEVREKSSGIVVLESLAPVSRTGDVFNILSEGSDPKVKVWRGFTRLIAA